MKRFQDIRLVVKLPAIIIALGILSVAVISISAYTQSRAALVSESENRLIAASSGPAIRLKDLLHTVEADLHNLSSDTGIRDALVGFTNAFRAIQNPTDTLQRLYIEENPHPTGEKNSLLSANSGSEYDRLHAYYHDGLDTHLKVMGF